MQVVNEYPNDNAQQEQDRFEEECRNWEKRRKRGKIMFGVLLIVAGALWLIKRTGGYIPDFIFSWPMLLVAFGIISFVKHGFRNFGWLILLAVGGLFLMERFFPSASVRTWSWPLLIMIIGLVIIFKPRKRFNHDRWHRHWKDKADYYEKKKDMYNSSSGDRLEVNTIFGGVRKTIISKNFRGGEVNSVFGGSEINLSQADIEGVVQLELNQVFGSTTLIVPSHWRIRPELTSVMGGIEDKRNFSTAQVYDENKVLVLDGNCVFGGIQIKSA